MCNGERVDSCTIMRIARRLGSGKLVHLNFAVARCESYRVEKLMEVSMDVSPKPTKERVRCYMRRQQLDHRPPPSMEEIRRQLGWAFYIDPEIKKSSR